MSSDQTVSHQEALIYTMIITSAADSNMTDPELHVIGEIVSNLPVFEGVDATVLPAMAEHCAGLLGEDDGLEKILQLISDSLPEALFETAYALACEVAAADLHVEQEESRMLEMIRHCLGLERLVTAAIERGTRARFTVV